MPTPVVDTEMPPPKGLAAALSSHPSGRDTVRDPVRGLLKGQQTKQAIVDAALGLATQMGLEGLSIGVLAEVMHMSKSGVFAHFGSREELQISVVREYFNRFQEEIFEPAMLAPRGLPRLRALFANWMKRIAVEIRSGCIFISGAVEFDDRTGPVRDALSSSVMTWLQALLRSVQQAQQFGHLDADADDKQIAFEIHGLILALHYEARFLKNSGSIDRAHQGFENILLRFGAEAETSAPKAESRSSNTQTSAATPVAAPKAAPKALTKPKTQAKRPGV